MEEQEQHEPLLLKLVPTLVEQKYCHSVPGKINNNREIISRLQEQKTKNQRRKRGEIICEYFETSRRSLLSKVRTC